MSAKYMGMVYELDLPFNKSWVLLAMADHADHQGKNVFPSLPLIAWKTGYSLSSVKRIVADLRDDGILIPYSQTQFGVKVYSLEFDHVSRKKPFVDPEIGRPVGRVEKHPRKTPSQIDTGFCDTHNRHTNYIESNSRSSNYDSNRNTSNYNDKEIDSLFDDEEIY